MALGAHEWECVYCDLNAIASPIRQLCPRRKSVFGEVDAPPHINLQSSRGRLPSAS